jgi:hypothetical protein
MSRRSFEPSIAFATRGGSDCVDLGAGAPRNVALEQMNSHSLGREPNRFGFTAMPHSPFARTIGQPAAVLLSQALPLAAPTGSRFHPPMGRPSRAAAAPPAMPTAWRADNLGHAPETT